MRRCGKKTEVSLEEKKAVKKALKPKLNQIVVDHHCLYLLI